MSNSKSSANIAVAGAGWWSQGWHLPLLSSMKECILVAIIEPQDQPRSTLVKDMLSSKGLTEKYGCPVYDSLDALLASNIATELDGIIICTPHSTHADISMKCFAANLNILCEKPMTTDVDEALMLQQAAKTSPKVFMVNNTSNWRPKSKYIYDRISRGEIGEISHVQASFHVNLLWLFEDPLNTGWVNCSGKMKGNGFCWGQLSHTLAWIYQVTNLTPIKVSAFLGKSNTTNADLTAAISLLCWNGATISISGVANHKEDCKVISNTIIGSTGTVVYQGKMGSSTKADHGHMEWTFADPERPDEWIDGFEFENLNVGVDESGAPTGTGPESVYAFVAACRGGDFYNGANAEVGAKVVCTIDAIYVSDAESRVAEVEYSTSS